MDKARKTKLGVALAVIAIIVVAIVILVSRRTHFVPLQSREQIERVLQDRVLWIQETSINDFQKQQLIKTLADILMIYRDGDFEQFLNYLRQRRGRFDPSRMAGLRDILANLSKISPEQLRPEERQEYQRTRQIFDKIAPQFPQWPPKDDLSVFKAHWLLTYHDAGVWSGIEVKTAYIRVFQTNQPINPNTALAAIQSPNRLVFYRNTSFPGEQDAPCLYAEVYLVARHPTPDPYWGYYLWLRWSNAIQNWFLDLAGMTFSGNRSANTDLLF